MIAQDRLVASSFTEMEPNIAGRQVSMDHFLKESVQILLHAHMSIVGNRPPSQQFIPWTEEDPNDGGPDNDPDDDHDLYRHPDDGDDDEDDDDDNASVTWKLNLSPTMMTLDTNIQTIAGLEKVLEQLRANVQSAIVPITPIQRPASSEHYDMTAFAHAMADGLRLSSVFMVPRTDVFRQCNSMQLMRQCVQIFVMCGGALVMDVPRLLAETDMVLSHPSASKEHPTEALLMLSICSAMIRHVIAHQRGHPNVAAGLMHTYYMQARLLLQDLFDYPHINVIYAHLLLSLYPHSHTHLFSPARMCSPLLSAAVRSAMAMDLHKLDSRHDDESEQKEHLRRLAWMILCADHFADWNESGQRTGRINATDWHVNFPQPLPSEHNARQVEWFAQYCRVVMIRKMHLFRSAYMVVQHSSRALEEAMDEKLFQKYLRTPETFALDAEVLSGQPYMWQKSDLERLLLQDLHCNTLIQAHLPFFPRRYLATLHIEEALRADDLTSIYQQLVQSYGQATFISPLPHASTSSPSSQYRADIPTRPTPADHHQELHCVVGCLAAANTYTLVLEALSRVDPIGCRHSPVHGTMMTALVYHLIQMHCNDPDVVTVCRLNLGRTLRILNQARAVHPDSTILYLQRALTRWSPAAMDDVAPHSPQRTAELIRALKSRQRKDLSRESSNDGVGIKSEPL